MSDAALSSLDAQIELRDLRLAVLNKQPIDPLRYHKLIDSLQRNRESRARQAAAEAKKGKKALAATVPIDLTKLFGDNQ